MNQVLVIGKPNSGKSLLFNKLTGLAHKVANFPGVTVEVHTGSLEHFDIVDFPGVYSLHPLSRDEKVAIEHFKRCLECQSAHTILCLLDATRLERSLILALQVLELAREHGIPVLFALNMMDQIQANRLSIDVAGLSGALGAPIVPLSAKSGVGVELLKKTLLTGERGTLAASDLTAEKIPQRARELAASFGPQGDVLVRMQNRLDRFFLSTWWGGLSFLVIMLLLFQSIFTWSAPLMDGVESLLTSSGEFASAFLPAGPWRDFVQDALFGGLGSFLVFVPQIAVLTLLIGLLEDSGYLSRASLICHRPFSLFGLSGKSFVPYLTGHACAIPAIYAARTIESPRQRLLTILTIPLMSCSARLPVYSLLVAVFIPPIPVLGGVITWQGLSFFLLYLLGIVTALGVSALVSRWQKRHEGNDLPFVLELPPYRLPSWSPLVRKSLRASKLFALKAGPIIFVVTLIIWLLGYFPGGAGQLQNSYLASLGQWIGPIFAPLGLDWRYGVAILTSFLAREVFVGTLGTFYGIEAADENLVGLAEQIRGDELTLAAGLALLVFYALALQCVSTLAVIKQETGRWRYPLLALASYTLLAYALAWLTYTLLA